jgi:hypothetical protein
MSMIADRLPDATTNEVHDIALDARDLARSTHQWVVLIGWIVIIEAVLGILGGAYTWSQYAKERDQVKARIACIQASSFQTVADCSN